MGRYWDNEGPHQAEYDRLYKELVPNEGECATVEGECLRAAARLQYEFYNNGGGNNVSGALNYLSGNFPDYDWKCHNVLKSYVTGHGGVAVEAVYTSCEKLLNDVVKYVEAKNGEYSVNFRGDMYSLTQELNGHETYADRFTDDEIEDDNEYLAYS